MGLRVRFHIKTCAYFFQEEKHYEDQEHLFEKTFSGSLSNYRNAVHRYYFDLFLDTIFAQVICFCISVKESLAADHIHV